MPGNVRTACEADLATLAAIDVAFTTRQVLSVERSGTTAEPTFEFRWRTTAPRERLYDELSEEGLRRALTRADLFLVADVGGDLAGYLMMVLPDWTDAGEITDLAVHRPLRRGGVGARLVGAAADWATARGLRALWVEPGADNAGAIDFYRTLGFRISGFNDRMYSNRDDERPTILMYLELQP